MNLSKKKQLVSRTLKIGKNRIVFSKESLGDIKEAITKQDIRDLYKEGIITIKPIRGRKKVEKRKTRRGFGKIKKKIKNRKQIYVKLIRKLRAYISGLRKAQVISTDMYKSLRKKIKNNAFKSKAHLKEFLGNTGESGFGIRKSVQKEKKIVGKKSKKNSENKLKEKKKE